MKHILSITLIWIAGMWFGWNFLPVTDALELSDQMGAVVFYGFFVVAGPFSVLAWMELVQSAPFPEPYMEFVSVIFLIESACITTALYPVLARRHRGYMLVVALLWLLSAWINLSVMPLA